MTETIKDNDTQIKETITQALSLYAKQQEFYIGMQLSPDNKSIKLTVNQGRHLLTSSMLAQTINQNEWHDNEFYPKFVELLNDTNGSINEVSALI